MKKCPKELTDTFEVGNYIFRVNSRIEDYHKRETLNPFGKYSGTLVLERYLIAIKEETTLFDRAIKSKLPAKIKSREPYGIRSNPLSLKKLLNITHDATKGCITNDVREHPEMIDMKLGLMTEK